MQHEVKVNIDKVDKVQEGLQKFVTDVVANLKTRFPHNKLFAALEICNFMKLPNSEEEWHAM